MTLAIDKVRNRTLFGRIFTGPLGHIEENEEITHHEDRTRDSV
jgi:hypothetical protein